MAACAVYKYIDEPYYIPYYTRAVNPIGLLSITK